MTYRDDVEALAARKAALDRELTAKTRERDDAGRLLAEAQARSRLPVLPNLRIASPCRASWDDMKGDDRVRHCTKCDKDVFNVSALTREQAESLILEKKGDLCARYYQRKDGTILLADCEVGRKRQQRVRMIAAGMAITITAGTTAAVMMRTTHHEKEKPQVIQGGAMAQPEVDPSTGIPGCDDYRDAIRDLQTCEAMPAESRAALWQAYEQAAASWAKLPESARAAVEDACKQGAATIRHASDQVCGTHVQQVSPRRYASQRNE